MNFATMIPATAAALFLTLAPVHASPCAKDIAETEAAFDAKLNAAAAAGPTATESTAATLHHQPTPGSVARVEAQIGDIAPANAQAVTEAIGKAHAADEAGDVKACEQALAEARQALAK